MRKLRALIGLPVVCGNRRVGRLLQPQLSEDLRQLDGIWISAGLRGTRYISTERLEMLGQVAVISEDGGRRGRMRPGSLLKRAVSTDGRRLGAVTGAEIDELSFAVTALELSAGFWDDLLYGRQRIHRYTVNRESGEVIIDPAAIEMEGVKHESQPDEGLDRWDADRRIGGDDLWRDELADRKEVEAEGKADGQLDL